MSKSDAWLRAIDEVASPILHYRRVQCGSGSGNTQFVTNRDCDRAAASAVAYLEECERVLSKQGLVVGANPEDDRNRRWHSPPKVDPPPRLPLPRNDKNNCEKKKNGKNAPNDGGYERRRSNGNNGNDFVVWSRNNPFSILRGGSTSSDEEDEGSYSSRSTTPSATSTDRDSTTTSASSWNDSPLRLSIESYGSVTNPVGGVGVGVIGNKRKTAGNDNINNATTSSTNATMTSIRIKIRLLSTQSDLLSYLAGSARRQQNWVAGAEFCARAVDKVGLALQTADDEVQAWMRSQKKRNKKNRKKNGGGTAAAVAAHHFDYMKDADVVSMCVKHLAGEKERFVREADRQRARLEDELLRLRQRRPVLTREQLIERMGDRYFNNPNPKNDFRKRRDDERMLQQIRDALLQLTNLKTEDLQWDSALLRQKLTTMDDNSETVSTQRNNGIRPDPMSPLAYRVSAYDYPDPTSLGYVFTGSCEQAGTEFFQSYDNIKVDWYYAVAGIRLSHTVEVPSPSYSNAGTGGGGRPKTKVLQYSAKQLTPSLYRQVLANPQAYLREVSET